MDDLLPLLDRRIAPEDSVGAEFGVAPLPTPSR